LAGLAKRYYEKKAKKSSSLSVGDTPSLTPGSLESASLTTWTTQLSTLEARASDHDKFGQDLITQVVAPLEYAQKRFDDLRKSHAEYQTKLLRERDSSYGDLKKLKGRYDTACQEVENRRKKNESAMDHGRTKAASAYNQQLMEMHNVKNTYLIGINVTNKLKECYYHEYVPELLDSLQDLSEVRVFKLNSLWSLASSLETSTLQRGVDQMKHLSSEILRNNPSLDSIMFVRHNATQWTDPPDSIFEPSPVWLDQDAMAIDETSKIFLRNILSKSKPLVRELKLESDAKRREVQGAKMVRQNIRDGKDKRDEVEIVKAIFSIQEDLHSIDRKRLTAEVETSTITSVAGDLSLRGKNHTFKQETFKIPTNCDLCGDRIWGLNAKGFSCTDCGFTCHSKCEMKVPAECPGEQTKEEKKKLKAERQAAANAAVEAPVAPVAPATNGMSGTTLTRQDTMNSLSSGYATGAHRSLSGTTPRVGSATSNGEDSITPQRSSPLPTTTPPITLAATPAPAPAASNSARKNRIVAPPPAAYVSAPMPPPAESAAKPRAKLLYPYEARDAGELSVDEGKECTILEPDGENLPTSSVLWAILIRCSE
jgi:formin-binding protein 1